MNKIAIAVLFIIATTGIGTAQITPKPAAEQSILIENEGGKITRVSATDLAKLPRISVKANDHGTATTFEGVSLAEVLKLGGVVFGETLRGQRLATYVLAEAADKYRVVFALTELDTGFTDKLVILADKRDGKPLPENAGPWQIVTPDEKRAGRWVRQIASLKAVLIP